MGKLSFLMYLVCILIFQHSSVYVKRSGKFQHEKAIKQLDLIVKDKVPVRLPIILYFRIHVLM